MSERLEIGSTVVLDTLVQARITAIMIRDKYAVSYEVVWWNERVRHVEWVESWEVKTSDPDEGVSQVL